ncbi:MAG: hypothetical protein JWQ19_467, partial [Subtercola sp.]|nr:hypothetical protein [Subtercola sp.]
MTESEPEFDVALPGEWMIIPLLSATAARAAVARIVAQGVGRRDEDARLRAELRASFTTAVDQARGAGATQLHLCRELVAGVPLPASLTVYWPRLSLAATRESDPLAALRKLLGPAPAAASGSGPAPAVVADPAVGSTEPREERVSDVDLTDFAAGPTVRRTRLVTGRPAAPPADRPAVPASAPAA